MKDLIESLFAFIIQLIQPKNHSMCDKNGAIQFIVGKQRQSVIEMMQLLENSFQPQKLFLQLFHSQTDSDITKIAYDSSTKILMRMITKKLIRLNSKTNFQFDNEVKISSNYTQMRQRFKNVVSSQEYKHNMHKNGCHCQIYSMYFTLVLICLLCICLIFGVLILIDYCFKICHLLQSHIHGQFIKRTNRSLDFNWNVIDVWKSCMWVSDKRLPGGVCHISYIIIREAPFIFGCVVLAYFLMFICIASSKHIRIYFKGTESQHYRLKAKYGQLRLIQLSHTIVVNESVS